MRGETVSTGLRATLATFIVALLMATIPAASQVTSARPSRQATSIGAPARGTNIRPDGPATGIPAAPPATSIRPADEDELLWNFGNGTDGSGPQGGLIVDAGGNIYGTTYSGGKYGGGTVFGLTYVDGVWQEFILWSFGGTGDGIQPNGTLIFDSSGNLWGTTYGGGEYGLGTVFEVYYHEGVWYEVVQYSFQGNDKGKHDGRNPLGGLAVDSYGIFWGTTEFGGEYDEGTGFQFYYLGGKWNYAKLWDLGCEGMGCIGDEAENPTGELLIQETEDDEYFYGTSLNGGEEDAGAVFSLLQDDINGDFYDVTLLSFRTDEGPPVGGVIMVEDHLYGMTERGGTHDSGIVYDLSRLGHGRVLHNFGRKYDGINPLGRLFYFGDGFLYGTTSGGGQYGFGTVFQLSLGGGADTVLYSFQGPDDDGSSPSGSVTFCTDAGLLCGTTSGGGKYNGGTVFALYTF